MDALRDHPEVLYGFALALLIVILLTPAVGGMARLLGVVDQPGRRRLNVNPVPRLGGLAIFFGIFVPALAFLELGPRDARRAPRRRGRDRRRRDRRLPRAQARAEARRAGDRGLDPAASSASGSTTSRSRSSASSTCPTAVGMTLTVVWIVAVMNMVNFLDGLDGLAAGVCAIAALTYVVLALSLEKIDPAILSAIIAGACIGFLRHNFFPARIFMGDSGSARARASCSRRSPSRAS